MTIKFSKKILFKLSVFCLVILCMVASATAVFATNIGVGENIPDDSGISTKGTSEPSSSWNISSNGTYSYSGQSAWHWLYTNYYFVGKTKYTAYTTNTQGYPSSPIRVELMKKRAILSDITLDTVNVSAQSTGSVSASGLSTSDKIYVAFKSPTVFSGYIR